MYFSSIYGDFPLSWNHEYAETWIYTKHDDTVVLPNLFNDTKWWKYVHHISSNRI